ncbi:MAG: hypothetical protein KAT43_03000 [Nanoarchaeota archaeon]|nr:hypothetical protein [Nanoarchaeota archaeon]
MKRGLIVLILILMLVPISIASDEYYLPGEEPEQPTVQEQAPVVSTTAQEKQIVVDNYYQIIDLSKAGLNFCRKKEHASAIEKLNEAHELANDLEYVNSAFKRLTTLLKVWILCASYQEESDDQVDYILGAGRTTESAMEKAEAYIQAHNIRAAQMFFITAGSWEKMRYRGRNLETPYDQKYTCEMELYCLEKAKELEFPQADAALNKLASSGECEGFSAVAPEEQAPIRTEEEQEIFEELLEPKAEEVKPEPQEPTVEVEEKVPAPTESKKLSLLFAIISIFAIIFIICAVILILKKKYS